LGEGRGEVGDALIPEAGGAVAEGEAGEVAREDLRALGVEAADFDFEHEESEDDFVGLDLALNFQGEQQGAVEEGAGAALGGEGDVGVCGAVAEVAVVEAEFGAGGAARIGGGAEVEIVALEDLGFGGGEPGRRKEQKSGEGSHDG
jgi:hypothetical protein